MSVQKFVLSGDASVLRSVLQILATDPEAAVISVVEDRRAQLERVVVLLDEERAEALATALGGRLSVEPDAPLLDPEPANGSPADLFPLRRDSPARHRSPDR